MPAATPLYILADAPQITAALRASIFQPTVGVSFPDSVLGDTRQINVYLITSDGQYNARSGAVGVTPRLALARKNKAATGGTFTVTFGANTTTALAYNATADQVETALNALASVTSAGGLDVSGAAGGPYTLLFRSNGARALMTASAVDLIPSSGMIVSQVLIGDGSTRAVQSIRIQTRVVALCESWTTLYAEDLVTPIGWNGTLSTNTVDVLEMLEASTEVDATVEFEVTESGQKTTLMQQEAKVRYDIINDGALAPLVVVSFATAAEVASKANIDASNVAASAAAWRTAIGAGAANGLATLDASSKVPIAQIPTSDIQIIFRKGTDAERQTVIFAEGEGIYTTDLKEFWIGDGVTLGGVRPNPSYIVNTGSAGAAGANLGGSGAPGAGGATVTPIVDIDGGAGGANAASGTGNGGAASTITTPILLKATGGNGGAANGNFSGGAGGTVSNANIIEVTGSNGGAAGTGGDGRAGNVVGARLLLVTAGHAAPRSTGTGLGGGASLMLNQGPFLHAIGGNGGAANGNFSGGDGGSMSMTSSGAVVRVAAGSGGDAGTGGNGGAGGMVVFGAHLIRLDAGLGGAGGTGAAGGNGGTIGGVLRAAGGNGGTGGAAGETGGNGGNTNSIRLIGGNGATGTGGLAGGAGGAAGSITLNGGNASGTTAGGEGGAINLSAVGTTPSASILFGTAAPEGVVTAPPGSLYLRNNAGAGEMWLKTSGTGNTGWTLK